MGYRASHGRRAHLAGGADLSGSSIAATANLVVTRKFYDANSAPYNR